MISSSFCLFLGLGLWYILPQLPSWDSEILGYLMKQIKLCLIIFNMEAASLDFHVFFKSSSVSWVSSWVNYSKSELCESAISSSNGLFSGRALDNLFGLHWWCGWPCVIGLHHWWCFATSSLQWPGHGCLIGQVLGIAEAFCPFLFALVPNLHFANLLQFICTWEWL